MIPSLEALLSALPSAKTPGPRDEFRRTPLHYAARDGLLDFAIPLLQRGANPNASDANGETPLHFAAREYHPPFAQLLLDHGAQVDPQDAQGNTPLFRAVFYCKDRGELIKLLLAAGADKSLKNHHGISPESLAQTIATHNASQFLT